MNEKLYEVVLKEDEEAYDYRQVLNVIRNGKIVLSECDGGEPEDQSFGRNWSWVEGALKQAYQFGLEDGRKEK